MSPVPQESRSDFVPALGYRWLTPLYDSVVAATTREATFKRELVEQAHVAAGHRVLDLGCGTGTLAILIKGRQPSALVTGVDGDPAMLERATHKAASAGVSITFDHALSWSLPYADATFDRATSSLFFHHLTWDDKLRTAREALRVLKPGGELHVADWGRATNPAMRGLFLVVQTLDGFVTTRDNVAGRLPEVFAEAGFSDVAERRTFSTMLGSLALYRAVRPAWRAS